MERPAVRERERKRRSNFQVSKRYTLALKRKTDKRKTDEKCYLSSW